MPESELERLSLLIIESMRAPYRCFHTPQHVFAVAESNDPIEVLAALFHDLIYLQVDGGLSVNFSILLAPFLSEQDGKLLIRPEVPQDSNFDLVRILFGLEPGQSLGPNQNEFLSALVAVKLLEPWLPSAVLLQIAACIEATIPFRPRLDDGMRPCDLLYERTLKASSYCELGLTDVDLLKTVQRAVRLANRDLENFAHPAAAIFLDNTWRLLPEMNDSLRDSDTYTVRQYRTALQKMEVFMRYMKPALVFQQFQAEPIPERYTQLLARTDKNLEVARLYLGIKLVAIAILEAIAAALGQDIPLVSLVGYRDAHQEPESSWIQRLPDAKGIEETLSPLESEALMLLEEGRTQDADFDIRNSPLSTLLVKSYGFATVLSWLESARSFFRGELTSGQLLAVCDSDAVSMIKEAISQEFENRRQRILDLAPETLAVPRDQA
ncbi:MAG: hypothetical protein AAGF24_02735 [Cyanobacteria bacterium P01_H01_bin.121]